MEKIIRKRRYRVFPDELQQVLLTEYTGARGEAKRLEERFNIPANVIVKLACRLRPDHRKYIDDRCIYSEEEVCEGFGCPQQALDAWVLRGCLHGKVRRQDALLPSGRKPRFFTDAALYEFIRRYPGELRPYQSSLDLLWVLDLAAGEFGLGELHSPLDDQAG